MSKGSAFTFHPALDRVSLHRFYAGNLVYASDMFSLYVQQSPVEACVLESLLKAEDWEGLAFHLHKLRTSIAMVGLSQLAGKCLHLKQLIRQQADNPRLLRSLTEELLRDLHMQLPLIRDELSRMRQSMAN